MTLEQLSIGEWAIIETILKSEFQLKLAEMGIYKGRRITMIQKSLGSDPICFQLQDTKIMLRKHEASTIGVSKCTMPDF